MLQALGFSKNDIVDEFYQKEVLSYDKNLNKWKTKFDPENYKSKNFSEEVIDAKSNKVIIKGFIDNDYDIPNDSILKIKSNGIFGKKALSIDPGFGDFFDKSNSQYVFNQTQYSYSVDTFLRYLNGLNE